MNDLSLALRLARRELRGGLRGFRVFVACLALGVAAIAGVGSLAASIRAALEADGRVLLGGDIDLTVVHRPAEADQIAYIERAGTVSSTIGMRAMAQAGDRRSLVELKAVDGQYPLYGEVMLEPAMDLREALATKAGIAGAVADPNLLLRLGLGLGARLSVGDSQFEVRATIRREPDRGTNIFILGPRLMIGAEGLAATGLMQPGSLIDYRYRVALPNGVSPDIVAEEIRATFPDAPWRIRRLSQAAAGMQRFVDRMAQFLTLVGLSALLVGGVGVANAVRAYLDGKTETIATLKCLGAQGRLILQVYLLQILALAVVGILIGLIVGALAPVFVAPLLGDSLSVTARLGFHPGPLLMAAAYGLLTALAFSLWPLGRAREVPAAALFRDLVAPARRWPRPVYMWTTGGALAGLAALTVLVAEMRNIGVWFILGAILVFGLFRGAGWLLSIAARRAGGMATSGRPGLRLALANLHRPGTPAPSIVLSLGLGLTVLVAVAVVHGNLEREIRQQLPAVAPSFFFIDIQPDQTAAFDDAVRAVPGVGKIRRVPSLRGRISRIGDVSAEEARVRGDAQWATQSERGLTYSATVPDNSEVVQGAWWPAAYSGPALVSLEVDVAEGMGIGVGDRITVNVLGRDMEATVANLRRLNWSSLGINFVLVFSPGMLEAAPHTHIATVEATPAAEAALERAVAERFPNISAIRVKEALDAVDGMLGQISAAASAVAALTLAAGVLVLAGAVSASHRRRVYDAVMFKVLGARRRMVLRTFLTEFALIGVATAALAALIGTVIAGAIMTGFMRIDWIFLPGTAAATIVGATVAIVALGFVGTWRALGQKAAPVLRNA